MCKYCEDKKQLLTMDISNVSFADFCTGEEELQLIIDRGYLRLGKSDDMDCLDAGEKVKIKYCPMCGNEIDRESITCKIGDNAYDMVNKGDKVYIPKGMCIDADTGVVKESVNQLI